MQDKNLEETVKSIESKESGKVARKKGGMVDVKVAVVKSEDDPNTQNLECNRMGHSSNPKDR